jgi:type I restriction enzyme R subunit
VTDQHAYLTPEAKARLRIDVQLEAAGFAVQHRKGMNLYAKQGVAVREFPLVAGHGFADYLLFVNGQAVGVVEAKKEGETLSKVEPQTGKYSVGLPAQLDCPSRPLPFLYESTGVETEFTNLLDPIPRSRPVFAFHRPETMAKILQGLTQNPAAPTLRARLASMPPLERGNLRDAQFRGLAGDPTNLGVEPSLARNDPRLLLQMTGGAGKTFLAVNEIYRQLKVAGAAQSPIRALFLVDRKHLGRQALLEFEHFITPDDGRKFTDLYSVQLLTSNAINPSASVVIGTVQRLYSILAGEAEMPEELDEISADDVEIKAPVTVVYNPNLPIEFFDFMIMDECHRSYFGVWRQVLDYFDAFDIGLTATPTKQSLGWFKQNLVFEYTEPQGIADGVIVDFDVYEIRTRITAQGSTVEAGEVSRFRNRATRQLRLEMLEDDFVYTSTDLDRVAVAEDQIRTIWEHIRDHWQTDIFPGRKEFPKTLVFAKDDSHADDIIRIIREVFGQGNDFAKKITYKTKDGDPETLIGELRNEYYPRIAVTVRLIDTGMDVKPLEMLVFMRTVDTPHTFEQMKYRANRSINPTDLQAVSGADAFKERFVLIDTVGVMHQDRQEAVPLERHPTVSLEKLLQRVADGERGLEIASTVAARLARLDRRLSKEDRDELAKLADGAQLASLANAIVEAIDPDFQQQMAIAHGVKEPTTSDLAKVQRELIEAALKPLASNPSLRKRLVEIRRHFDQLMDEVSQDEVLVAGFSVAAKERATAIVESWRRFIEENKDSIQALQILYSRPYAQRLTYAEIKELARAIALPPHSWTPERLWQAYETLERSKVRGSGGRVLTDLVSLVRYALDQDNELVPFTETVHEKFDRWLMLQEQSGRTFTEAQLEWLYRIRDHLATSLTIETDDFDLVPFSEHGGLGKASAVLGPALPTILEELNELVAA